MKNMTPVKIGISGKRFISPKDKEKVFEEIREKIEALLRKHRSDDFVGYCALASGADTIFAEVVIKELGKPLHIILPFAVEEYEKDFTGDDLELFRHLIGRTSKYELAAAIPKNADMRNAAYYHAGKNIVDRCDEIIIVWDELRPGGPGGTAEILGYLAEKKLIHPISFIKVNPATADPLHDELIRSYHQANRLAIKSRNRYKRVWKWAIFLGWMAVLCFAVKTSFRLEEVFISRLLTLFEFLFVLAVYILIFFARRKNYHGNYIKARMQAEAYRLLKSFYHAGVEVGISDQSKEESPMLAELAEKINHVLKSTIGASKWYTQYVIKCLIREQHLYHNHKIKSIGNKHQVFERINLFIGVFFVVNLAVHLAHLFIIREGAQDMWLYKFSVFFNIILPASYAALEGVIYFNEWALLRMYSDSAMNSFKEAEQLLPENLEQWTYEECYKKQAQVLHLIASIMLTDNRNWNLLLENKDNYHLIV